MLWDDSAIVMKSFYGMSSPNSQQISKRDKKVKQMIKEMGDKYLLAKKMGRLK